MIGLLNGALLLLLVVAIPLSAAFTTVMATSRSLNEGEAYALATHDREAAPIRFAHRVSWATFGLYWIAALALVTALPVVLASQP